ncbi:kinase-like domain-containing protein, partial [Mycena crocata]
SGMNHLHQLGFIHRDIKPSNILVNKGGHCLITDFDICFQTPDATAPQLGRPGFGTIGFAAPELNNPDALDVTHFDARSDLYSLGATLYDLLGGMPDGNVEWMPPDEMIERMRFKGAPEEVMALVQGVRGVTD